MREWIVTTILTLPFCAFSQTRIDKVRRDQRYACLDCGTDDVTLQVHHKVPQRFYGTDREINALALCPECHRKWDALADQGVVYPGVGYEEVDQRCFENPQVRRKIISQFMKFGDDSSSSPDPVLPNRKMIP